MPLHLTSRRQFLTQLGAAAAWSSAEASATEVDESLIAILNDTHVGAQHPPSASIPTNLRNTVAWLLALPQRPTAVIINGDLALRDGQRGDYEHFAKLIAPLREAGVTLHLTMGNHDAREVFYEVLASDKAQQTAAESRHVGIVKLKVVNLYLLDSLKQTMSAPGDLGAAQRDWLAKALDANADKPALIIAHHNPRLGGDPKHFPGGLEDSEALWQMLAERPQVKAYIHGHIHHRDFFAHEGIHILNTPAVGYVADKKTSTTGWTMAKLGESGGSFTTHTHQADHAWNGVTVSLKWRA
ncbi:MAG: metallophosphoesterase family protein [Prosthecobacter sp.]|uniref:metallophosphoesterase family protein n=1 Tax=Prosthecobacter sp. TaxID=1965333 RepID=UPI0039015C81